jgi:glutamyl-tRNA synthetase
MRQGIVSGEYEGWDDIRLGTLRALARRGIVPGAVRQAVVEIGIGETDISFSWDNLYAQNRMIVDPVANRFFFVPHPAALQIGGAPHHVAHALLHPNEPARGNRVLPFTGTVLVSREELEKDPPMIRLKDLFNVRVSCNEGGYVLTYAGDQLSDARDAKAPIIQWLPADCALPCMLRKQEGDIEGVCEPGVVREAGSVVQFERVGFARIDDTAGDRIIAYFTHR